MECIHVAEYIIWQQKGKEFPPAYIIDEPLEKHSK